MQRIRQVLIAALLLLTGTLSAAGVENDTSVFLLPQTARHTGAVKAIGFSHDSQRLLSAGLDKVVYSWDLLPRGAGPFPRAIRWEVNWGTWGEIHSLAAAPVEDGFVFGGISNYSTAGMAWGTAAQTAVAKFTDQVHDLTISALDFSPDGKWLVSSDPQGRVVLWSARGEQVRELRPADSRPPGQRPIAFVTPELVAWVDVVGSEGGLAQWQPVLYNLATQSRQTMENAAPMPGEVRALEAGHGRLLAADLTGRLHVIPLDGGKSERIPLGQHLTYRLAASPDGDSVACAALDVQRGAGALLWVDLSTKSVRRTEQEPLAVVDCAFSPDGRRLAYAFGTNIRLLTLRPDRFEVEDNHLIRGASRITAVELDEPSSTLRFATEQGAHSMRLPELQLQDRGPAIRSPKSPWSVARDRARLRLELREGNRLRGTIVLNPAVQGRYVSHAWIGPPARPTAVAIGTDMYHGIYLYQLGAGGDCRLLRGYVGHGDDVTALGSGPRFLVSGGADGILRVWSLADFARESRIYQRCGAELIRRGDQLEVTAVAETGPLAYWGVRSGDVLASVEWLNASNEKVSATTAEAILARLNDLPPGTQIHYQVLRAEREPISFNDVGLWHELLAFTTTESEWICWSPAGYYASSDAGERLVGWQENRGRSAPPVFHPALHFHELYYRPDAFRRLLAKGSLSAALREDPRPAEVMPLVTRPLKLPEVTFHVEPALHRDVENHRFVVHSDPVRITAEVTLPEGISPESLELVIDERRTGDAKGIERVRLPAATWEKSFAPGIYQLAVRAPGFSPSEPWTIECRSAEPAAPTLFLLALGASQYKNQKLNRLQFADEDAETVAETFQKYKSRRYQRIVTWDRRREPTRQDVLDGLAWLEKEMGEGKEIGHDVAIIFFSGHGYAAGGDAVLVPVDGDPDDFRTCITEDDLVRTCGKLSGRGEIFVVLDACHSSSLAFGKLMRALDHRQIVVISSSEEQSYEFDSLGLGAFTRVLVDGLSGKAVRQTTGEVDAVGLANYLTYELPRLASSFDKRQVPRISAFPKPTVLTHPGN